MLFFGCDQREKKVVSSSPGLVDYRASDLFFLFCFFSGGGGGGGNSNYRRIVINPANQKGFWG